MLFPDTPPHFRYLGFCFVSEMGFYTVTFVNLELPEPGLVWNSVMLLFYPDAHSDCRPVMK